MRAVALNGMQERYRRPALPCPVVRHHEPSQSACHVNDSCRGIDGVGVNMLPLTPIDSAFLL